MEYMNSLLLLFLGRGCPLLCVMPNASRVTASRRRRGSRSAVTVAFLAQTERSQIKRVGKNKNCNELVVTFTYLG